MWMLPSKVMPYLLRLATPLMDSSIVHWNNKKGPQDRIPTALQTRSVLLCSEREEKAKVLSTLSDAYSISKLLPTEVVCICIFEQIYIQPLLNLGLCKY